MEWISLLTLLLAAVFGSAEPHKCPGTRLVTNYPDLSDVNDFQVELFKTVRDKTVAADNHRSLLISPHTVWSSFVTAYFGSREGTQKEMEIVLKLLDKATTFHLRREINNLYTSKAEKRKPSYVFRVANRAYFNETVKLDLMAVDLLSDEIKVFNSNDLSGTVQEVNDFVSKLTEGRVTETVKEEDMEGALMVLVTSAYFQGRWLNRFFNTFPKPFFVSSNKTVSVDMMNQTASFRYGNCSHLGAHIIEMPYQGSEISMYALLPMVEVGPVETRLDTLMSRLSGPSIRRLIKDMQVKDVNLQMPGFQFDISLGVEIQEALKEMGMNLIFDPELADMSAFTTSHDLNIDKVIHKNHIEVNAEGTEAAAVSSLISTVLTAQSHKPEQWVQFHCNEPFLYIISDKRTSDILFMGTFRDPGDF